MSKHTPPPWSWVGPYPNGAMLLTGRDNAVIHSPHPVSISDGDKALIAAAPEMLEALEDLIPEIQCRCGEAYLGRDMHQPNSLCHHVAAIEAAIAKATGKD